MMIMCEEMKLLRETTKNTQKTTDVAAAHPGSQTSTRFEKEAQSLPLMFLTLRFQPWSGQQNCLIDSMIEQTVVAMSW